MKKITLKINLLASVLTVACMCTTPVLRAQGDDPAAKAKAEKKAENKAKRDAGILKRYDKNGNGQLDSDEAAAMKAEQEKAKAEKQAENKAKRDANMLKKYDQNGNGTLDPDEDAVMKADIQKAKAEKKAKKEKTES